MTSLWHVLLQTIHVSLIAVVILILKRLLVDKLSPRWQYGVWSILLISLFIPAGYFNLYIIPTFNLYFETMKVMIEKTLNSSYVGIYEVIYNSSILPTITKFPTSLTDYLFIVYVIGLLVSISLCIYRYFKLKFSLKQGIPPHEEALIQIKRVSEKYQLKGCKAMMLKGLPSPFVFGMIKPILVLPYDKPLDDKVILHELLHLNYYDSLQNVVWSLLKCLHWFNPFLRYVFKTMNNDMESLCDQRVLEVIKGEERREYGRILLSMVNEKYPSYFGTTSISNGGAFIKKRIEAIVRFKRYPKGMRIVSLCTIGLLFPLALGGTSTMPLMNLKDSSHYELTLSSARMYHCPTLVEAIDLYAKGIVTKNDIYLTALMPKQKQFDYHQELLKAPKDIPYSNGSEIYRVLGLTKNNKNEYEAKLLFHSYENRANINESTGQELVPGLGSAVDVYEYALIPIKIIYDRGWKVIQNGTIERDSFYDARYDAISQKFISETIIKDYEDITVKIDVYLYNYIPYQNYYGFDDVTIQHENGSTFLRNYLFSYEPNLNNQFSRSYRYLDITLIPKTEDYTQKGFVCVELDRLDEQVHMKLGDVYAPVSEIKGADLHGDSHHGTYFFIRKDFEDRFSNFDGYIEPLGIERDFRCVFENEEFLCENESQIYGIEILLDDTYHEFTFEVGGKHE